LPSENTQKENNIVQHPKRTTMHNTKQSGLLQPLTNSATHRETHTCNSQEREQSHQACWSGLMIKQMNEQIVSTLNLIWVSLMIIILQTSFIVEWHKLVLQKNGVNSLLEYHQHLLQNILSVGGALLKNDPQKTMNWVGCIIQIIYSAIFFPGGKMAHKQRIVK
jgi:hypothetical protein